MSIIEKPRTMFNKSRTTAFHSIFTVLRSELWRLEKFEPHQRDSLIGICVTKEEALVVSFLKRVRDSACL